MLCSIPDMALGGRLGESSSPLYRAADGGAMQKLELFRELVERLSGVGGRNLEGKRGRGA